MSLLFTGSPKKLRKIIDRLDVDGVWEDIENGGEQYRCRDGAILNYWPKSGKLHFQGNKRTATRFRGEFLAEAKKKRLVSGDEISQGCGAIGTPSVRTFVDELKKLVGRFEEAVERDR